MALSRKYMALSRKEFNEWVANGKAKGATHLIVVCDTFDYEDYPVYVMPSENVEVKKLNYNANMQRIMEIVEL